MTKVVCFGEILWDVFPTHKVIGGAPLNVAFRLASFGAETSIISRIGNDKNGEEVIEYLENTKLNIQHIQKDNIYPTGYVSVFLDNHGSATYDIFKPVAWDYISLENDNIKLISESDIFIFGSLSCRSGVSKNTLFGLVEKGKFLVFDVNLRKPYYTYELISELMQKVDFIKLNDEELDEITAELGFGNSKMKEKILFLSKITDTKFICVTRGSQGAILFFNGRFYENSGYRVKVEDTVGAGDSFLASLIFKLYIEVQKPDQALDFACRLGALVASKKGANPKIDTQEIDSLTIQS